MSIATMTIASLVLVSTLLLVGMGLLSYFTERARQEARLGQELSTTVEQLAISLAKPLFNLDRDRIGLVLDMAMRNPAIAGIAVQQSNNGDPWDFQIYRRRDANWDMMTVESPFPTAGFIAADSDIRFLGRSIGAVKVFATPRFVEQNLRKRFVSLLVQTLLFDGFTVAGLYLLLWKVVLKPLRILDHYAKAVTPGGKLPESLAAGDFNGELESLRVAIGEMVALLQTRLEAFQQKETTLSAVLNALPQAIAWKGLDGRYLGCNDGFARAAGLEYPSQLLGKHDLELPWRNGGVTAHQLDDQEVLRTGLPKSQIMESHLGSDGHPVWLHITKVPLLNGEGEPCVVLGVFDDITYQRQAEVERALLQEELNQIQKLESIGRLAGGIAHDSNNALMAILMHAELLRDLFDQGDPALLRVHAMETAAKRSADLIRQLLAFACKQIIEPKTIDLNEMLVQFQETVAPLLGKGIHIQLRPGRDLWKIRMDPSQVGQIIMNLVVNARDAMPQGGSIQIATSNLRIDDSLGPDCGGAQAGDYVQLTVSDGGVGMSLETLGKVFEPFFTTKELGKGTGLGLSTVFGIVKQNGGFINAHSELGLGTMFRIHLPSHRAEGTSLKTNEPSLFLRGGEGTILVVEDDEILRGVIPRVLGRLGYDFILADTPEDALRVCRQAGIEIDVLLTDVVMPGMNGKELWEQVQRLHPQTKVLFMSGYTADVLSEIGGLGTGAHFLQKPFTTADLGRKLKSVMVA